MAAASPTEASTPPPSTRTAGAASAGEILDAPDFPRAPSPYVSVELPGRAAPAPSVEA
ncbi:hypothetical protein ABZ871_30645 [Streptomyces populi]